MSKRKTIKIAIMLLLIVVTNILIFKYANLRDSNIVLRFNLVSDKTGSIQMLFSKEEKWGEGNSQIINYIDVGTNEEVVFSIPQDTNNLKFVIDYPSANLLISDLKLSYIGKNIDINPNSASDNLIVTNIEIKDITDSYASINSGEKDSFITYKFDNNLKMLLTSHKNNINYVYKFVICSLVNIVLFVLLKKPTSIFILYKDLYNSRKLIWNLAKNDFKTKYAGSYLGIIWAFIQPIITILVYWFVFEFGLKSSSPVKNIPFILWFATGLIPWFFFSDAIMYATNCLIEYSYLVKKVVFKISVLPIVKIISALFVHLVFIGFVVILYCLYGHYPKIYIIQLPYYLFCMFMIILAMSYITSAIVLFFKDLGQIISIFLQVGMWMTPIMWSYTIIPDKYLWILKLNPMFYVVEGYRDTFINYIWFWDKIFQTIYFWIISLIIMGIGALVFKRLKPHFADVL